MTPDEIHQRGQEELRELQSEMDAILKKQGYTQGTVGERMTALGKEARFRFEESDAGRAKLMAFLNARVADMRKRLPRAFATLVPGFFEIKRMAPEVEPGAPGAYGGPGTIDGKVPGKFWINMHTMSVFTTYNTPTLTYHESIPGHVWQGEYTFKLPLARSLLAFNAYSEGWALVRRTARERARGVRRRSFRAPGISAIHLFSRLPAGGRHRAARETLDPATGDRLVRQHQWLERGRGHRRSGSLLRMAGPGLRLQGGSQRDQPAARQGASRAWARASTCGGSTTWW